jgi:hypothetical protein
MQLMRALEQLLRPRMLILTPAVALLSWYLMSLAPKGSYDDPTDRVKAWFNPLCVL